MIDISNTAETEDVSTEWRKSLSLYEKPSMMRSVWQIVNTFTPFIATWAIMLWMVHSKFSYWALLPFIAIAGGLKVRIFILFHDCCHGSFFVNKNANRVFGYITGLLTFTPFEDWRRNHAGHHATTGDLDRRGVGDVWTLTVEEYLASSPWTRFTYRVFRNPIVLFVIGPLFVFLISQRFPHKGGGDREKNSVTVTNLLIVAFVTTMCLLIGWKTFLMLELPIVALSGTIGIWLFYVQHQYELVYWENHPEWDPMKAALEGSSYYKLPKVMQWFTGNIGLHHLHHLRPRIPNYYLQACFDNTPALHDVETLTFVTSLKSLFLNLWDETNQRLVSFSAIRGIKRSYKQETEVSM